MDSLFKTRQFGLFRKTTRGKKVRYRPPLPASSRSCAAYPSSNKPAEAATRSCVNNGPILDLIFRSDEAQSSSVVSIEA